MERKTRFELATLALARRCSTTELLPHRFVNRVRGAPYGSPPSACPNPFGQTPCGGFTAPWARRDSNSHGLPHWILSPARLPVPPLARGEGGIPSHLKIRDGSSWPTHLIVHHLIPRARSHRLWTRTAHALKRMCGVRVNYPSDTSLPDVGGANIMAATGVQPSNGICSRSGHQGIQRSRQEAAQGPGTMKRAIITVGLGFGDEGKGATVDFLARQFEANLVIRYCGGSQAGHNVQLADGSRHTFSQFGAGTLAPHRPRTYLGPNVVVDPPAMQREARHLVELGVPNPAALLTIHPRCLVST